MSEQFVIQKAQKIKSRARIGLAGPAGSGKTYSALVLAQGLLESPSDKVVVIDTERESSAKYANEWSGFEYDVLFLGPPYDPDRYTAAIKYCEAKGYKVCIIDSLSHAWAGEGGALAQVDNNKVRFGNNTYYAWRDVTPKHNGLVDAMLGSTMDIIACMRTKVEYAEEKENGKAKYRKIGTTPIQREGMDYEFDIVLELNIDHAGVVTKTRCSNLADKVFSPINAAVGQEIRRWLDSGAPAPEKPRTQSELIEYAKTLGMDAKSAGQALKEAGITSFDPARWDEMITIITNKAEGKA